jgi:eukaryotic-like serine/threonine-protein kinase
MIIVGGSLFGWQGLYLFGVLLVAQPGPLGPVGLIAAGKAAHGQTISRRVIPALNDLVIETRLYGTLPAAPEVKMVAVPSGTVTTCGGLEKKCRKMTVKSFELAQTEVTVAEFLACFQAGKCSRKHFLTFADTRFCNLAHPDGRGLHAVNCLDYFAAQEVCTFQGKRLPTLEEWQWAARGDDGRKYPWGNQEPDCSRANFHGDEGRGCGTSATSAVGSLPSGASPFGILDMGGNVMEWLETICGLPDDDPEGKETPITQNRRTYHQQMGGSFADSGNMQAIDFLCFDKAKTMNISLGVRCAK